GPEEAPALNGGFGGRLNFNAAAADDLDSALDELTGDGATATATETRIEQKAPARTVERQTTEQKIEAFYGVRQVGDQVVFAGRFEEAAEVAIAGDFNAWSPASTPMQRSDRGEWRTSL